MAKSSAGNKKAPSNVSAVGAHRARVVAVEGRSAFVKLSSGRPVRAAVASLTHFPGAVRMPEPGQEVLIVFEQGDPTRPIVVGSFGDDERTATASPGPSSLALDVDADGTRVRLRAKDEIVLECGKASITMRRNGKIIVRGTHVETNSEGTNRIKGGQVKIN